MEHCIVAVLMRRATHGQIPAKRDFTGIGGD